MIIKELNVIEFGGLSDRRFELTSGINIFEGDNEAGKSTLWLFIKFMLYGMPKKGHPERERAINRMSHRAIGTMTVSFEGEDYRIERSFSEIARGKVVVHEGTVLSESNIGGDVIVKGAILDEIADVAGQRINDLLARYKPNAFVMISPLGREGTPALTIMYTGRTLI